MKKATLPFTIGFLTLILFFSDCRIAPFDELKKDGLEQEWSIPLIESKKSFGDLISGFDPKAFIQIGADNSVVLKYKGNFTARTSLDIFANFRNVAFPLQDSVMAVPFSLPSGVHIDYVDVKQGTLRWAFLPPAEPLNITLSIPQLTKNGLPFTRQIRLTTLLIDTLDMMGWRLEAQNDSIFINTKARKISNGEPIKMTNGGGFQIQNFEFSFAKGYFGQSTFDGPQDSISIDFFDRWKNGSVNFDNAKMIVTLDNSFGIPVRSQMKLGEIVTIDGRRLPIVSPLTNGVDVNYPSLNEIGKSKRTVVSFDKTNSNINEVLSANPVAVQYDIDGLVNPNTSQRTTGFMTDSSKFEFIVEIEVPMSGKMKNFELNDTLNFDLSQSTDIQYAEFKVVTDNGMPIDLGMQGYFALDNGKVLDSLYTAQSPILRGASVNAQGLPTDVKTTESFIKIDAEKLKKIRAATKLIIRYTFSTTSGGSVPVKLVAAQSVGIRIGVKFGTKL